MTNINNEALILAKLSNGKVYCRVKFFEILPAGEITMSPEIRDLPYDVICADYGTNLTFLLISMKDKVVYKKIGWPITNIEAAILEGESIGEFKSKIIFLGLETDPELCILDVV